jgi:hypothetical protein
LLRELFLLRVVHTVPEHLSTYTLLKQMAHVIKQRPKQDKTREPAAEPLPEYRASDRLRGESFRFVFAPKHDGDSTDDQNRRAIPNDPDPIGRA